MSGGALVMSGTYAALLGQMKLHGQYGSDALKPLTEEELKQQRRAVFLARLGSKGKRMNDRMERRRDQIWKRNCMLVGQIMFWTIAPVAAVALISAVWRFCAWVIAA